MRVTETKTTLKGTASFDRPTPLGLSTYPPTHYLLAIIHSLFSFLDIQFQTLCNDITSIFGLVSRKSDCLFH